MNDKWKELIVYIVLLLIAAGCFAIAYWSSTQPAALTDYTYHAEHLNKLDAIIKLLKEIKHKV